jgi:hypothetical protein
MTPARRPRSFIGRVRGKRRGPSGCGAPPRSPTTRQRVNLNRQAPPLQTIEAFRARPPSPTSDRTNA